MLLNGLSLFFVATESLTFSVPAHTVIRGFPFHFIEQTDYGSGDKIKFLFGWFIANFIVWFVTVGIILGFFKIAKNKQRYDLVAWAFLLAAFLNYMSLNQFDSCVSGFPVQYNVLCGGVGEVAPLLRVYGSIINFIFWFVQSIIFVSFIYATYINHWIKKIRFFFFGVVITAFTFWYDKPCEGFLCIFAGRGSPIPYYGVSDSDGFIWRAFVIDIIFWSVFYLFTSLVFYLSKKAAKHRNYFV